MPKPKRNLAIISPTINPFELISDTDPFGDPRMTVRFQIPANVKCVAFTRFTPEQVVENAYEITSGSSMEFVFSHSWKAATWPSYSVRVERF